MRTLDTKSLRGLSSDEVREKKLLGLRNSTVDTYSPSYIRIFMRNFFTVMTIALTPLIIAQYWFELYRDAIVLTIFVSVSSLINTIEEIRVKRRLDKLKTRFKNQAVVIRDGMEQKIDADEIVQGDYIVAKEGDSIVADGRVLQQEFLQVDESALTGESDYLEKEKDEEVLSGSFVVTGECIYIAKKVGKKNYLNRLGAESTKYRKKRSRLEKYGDTFIYIFTSMGIVLALIHYFVLIDAGFETRDVILGVTTIIGVTIPQTLLILLVLTFIVSVTKLAGKGILIQKRGAIDDLSAVDTICIDKTGTITTNEMKIQKSLLKDVTADEIGALFYEAKDLLYGQNKTLKTVIDYFATSERNTISLDSFDQIPFTSKQKFSAFQVNNNTIVLGAFTKLHNLVDKESKKQIESFITTQEKKGRRLLVGLHFKQNIIEELRNGIPNIQADGYFVLAIEEELNPGIIEVLQSLKEQKIAVKVISGDSQTYVERVAEKVGITTEKTVDMSENDVSYQDIASENTIFARSTPEDKAQLIAALEESGHRVAMIGDGINDVIGLKKATVGVAMESGAKVARDVADIVLLENDYKKIPEIFYEGDNIVFNLKLSTKIFFARSIMMMIIAVYFTLLAQPIPLSPTSTLIFSFLGSTLATYILTFTRYKVRDFRDFFKDVFVSGIPSGFVLGLTAVAVYAFLRNQISFAESNTAMVIGILFVLLAYTLVLLWESNKIMKNLIVVVAGYIVTMLVGIFMTVLPIYAIETRLQQLFMIIMVVLGAFLIYVGMRYANKYQNAAAKASNYLVPIGFIPLALLFPSRFYYGTQPFPFEHFASLFIISLVGVAMLIAIHILVLRPISSKIFKQVDVQEETA